MAWQTGTATSYLDLLDIVRVFAAANGWTVLRNVTATEKEVIMKGSGSGTDEIYVGIRTYRDTNTLAFNWELAGFTGYASGNTWATQPGISPGRFDSVTPLTEGGSFVPLDNASFTYWCSVTPRRIIVIAKPGSAYVSAYLGFYNTFKTSSEHPYPLLIAGSSAQKETRFNSNRESMSFIAHPIGKNSNSSGLTLVAGPMQVRWVDGSWITFVNRYESQGTSNQNSSATWRGNGIVTPMSYPDMNAIPAENQLGSLGYETNNLIPDSGISPLYEIHPTPNGGTPLPPLFPVGLQMEFPSQQIMGELDGVYWVSVAGSGLSSEDHINSGGTDHLVIQNVFRTSSFQYMAVKEA